MVSENTLLNIERARAALAKARVESAGDAVRSPRPVDLSRLAELEQRRERLESRSSEFRGAVRQRLGLSDNSSPLSVSKVLGVAAMDGAICDAEVCAPPAPHMPARPGKLEAKRAPSAKPAFKGKRGTVKVKIRRKKFLGLF